ncbi:MAG: hypothetical protein QOI57_421 [Rubrobacteraceae bacterium]|nr:hypothetical protein [Rubrobacteraceae bacterium]
MFGSPHIFQNQEVLLDLAPCCEALLAHCRLPRFHGASSLRRSRCESALGPDAKTSGYSRQGLIPIFMLEVRATATLPYVAFGASSVIVGRV